MSEGRKDVFMRPDQPPRDQCPLENRSQCPLRCRYNHFESDDLSIWTWELKCLDCGYRETIGYRNDETEHWQGVDPHQCPFCQACDLSPGRDPCQ
jgi:hypothetical protein